MRIIIIGAVAAGTSAAAKARRNTESAEIVIYEKDKYISYSACGMPYYLGGEIKDIGDLTPRDPQFFKQKYNVDIFIGHEVLNVNPQQKTLSIKDLRTGLIFEDHYDKLILATGANALVPPITGASNPNVFKLRNINDLNRIMEFIKQKNPKKVIVVGTGYIGLEVCENLIRRNMSVTLIEMQDKVTPGLDRDMSAYVEAHVRKQNIDLRLETTLKNISDSDVTLSTGEHIPADMVLISTGVKPEVKLAVSAGIELGKTGAIKVDIEMKTNINEIYACGDCTEQYSLITGKPFYRPLGSTANKTGRIAGDAITGGPLRFRGVLGTGIFKLFDMTVALTGLTEQEARTDGFDIAICHNIKPDRPESMGGKEMVIKAIADKKTGKLLGVQIVGYEGVDKRIDVFATAITYGALAEDLFHLDLAYAPPYSTTKDPVMYTGMILDNAISKGREVITAKELVTRVKAGEDINIVDTRASKQYEQSHLEGAVSLPQEIIRTRTDTLDKNRVTVTYCNKGVTGNAVQNILLNKGFNKVYNLSGGHKNFQMTKSK